MDTIQESTILKQNELAEKFLEIQFLYDDLVEFLRIRMTNEIEAEPDQVAFKLSSEEVTELGEKIDKVINFSKEVTEMYTDLVLEVGEDNLKSDTISKIQNLITILNRIKAINDNLIKVRTSV